MAQLTDMCAVIPTRNRPTELEMLIYSLRSNGIKPGNTVIINNGGPLEHWFYEQAAVVHDEDPSPHIYRQWNVGLDMCRRWMPGSHIAVLNDDVELPDNFASRMTQVFANHSPTLAFPNQHGSFFNRDHHWMNKGQHDTLHKRMTGYAFVINGDSSIALDESFKWWYGDDDLDWRAREEDGTYLVNAVTVTHHHPNESTNNSPERQRQADRDRRRFIEKHGKAPW